jgi:hypothetical protein
MAWSVLLVSYRGIALSGLMPTPPSIIQLGGVVRFTVSCFEMARGPFRFDRFALEYRFANGLHGIEFMTLNGEGPRFAGGRQRRCSSPRHDSFYRAITPPSAQLPKTALPGRRPFRGTVPH